VAVWSNDPEDFAALCRSHHRLLDGGAALEAATQQYLTAMTSVLKIDDPTLSPTGIHERRRATIQQAQNALSALLPPEPAAAPVDRSVALDNLHPADGRRRGRAGQRVAEGAGTPRRGTSTQ